MVIEVLAAVGMAAMYVAGWCSKQHSCREHTKRQKQPRVAVARRVRPELPAA